MSPPKDQEDLAMKRKIGLLALIGVLLLSAATAWADGDMYVIAVGGGVGTKITSVPYAINQPGFYYLGGNLTATGNGITVNNSDVTLDLMGFTLTGPGRYAVPNTSGIKFGNSVQNVEIRNGTIRDFVSAVGNVLDINYYSNNRIINVRMTNNENGVCMRGFNLLIKGCTIYNGNSGIAIIDGSGTVSDNVIDSHRDYAININSGVWTITRNTLVNATGVLRFYAAGSIIGNTINGSAAQKGLWLTTDNNLNILVSQNTVSAGTPVFNGHAKIFYVGNVGLTNTNSFLAPP
jgi:hypothetical protein